MERIGKHGCSRRGRQTKAWFAWRSMRTRCRDPKCKAYHLYGGRGITVCDRWVGESGFANFLTDMGEPPSKLHSIDRFPDKNGNYEPGNCRWATRTEQGNNTRRNIMMTFQGRTQTMTQWANEIGVKPNTLLKRLRSGWSHEKALSKGLSA